MLIACVIIASAGIVSLAHGFNIHVVNNCNEVIYAAAGETNAGFKEDPNPPTQAEYEAGRIDPKYRSSPALPKGASWDILPQAKWIGGRVWARTGCTGTEGNLVCQTGDCGPSCASPYVGPPDERSATLAEIGYGHHDTLNRIFINLSKLQGWNVGVAILGGTRDVTCASQECGLNDAYGWVDPKNSSSIVNADAASAQLKVIFCPDPAPAAVPVRLSKIRRV